MGGWLFRHATAVLLLLAACAPLDPTARLTVPADDAGRACATSCEAEMTACADRCRVASGRCEAKEQDRAEQAYRDYLDMRRNSDMEPARSPSDFRRWGACATPPQCRVGCRERFTACYSACGGRVEWSD